MRTFSLLLALALASPPAPGAPRENLLRGPARLVIRYLDAVRLAEPRAVEMTGARRSDRETAFADARRLTAPRTLADIGRAEERGEAHPLAFWRDAGPRVLEGFQLLAVRRAARGAVVVTVEERRWTAPAGAGLARSASEYLVARVGGEWRVVARRPGGRFDDAAIAAYQGYWDEE